MRTLFLGMLFVALSFSPGCGGYYLLTVPDQLASETGALVPVVRLQRNDFFFLALAAPDQPMRFRLYPTPDTSHGAVGQSPLRSANTDKMGYAGVHFPMSEKPVSGKAGLYYMKVALQDLEGEELFSAVPVFVWNAAKPVVAVDLDCLPQLGAVDREEAAAALRTIYKSANLLYLTRRSRRTQERAHILLAECQYPDGPVLLWQRQRWHIVREGRFRLPRVVVESRLDSQLPKLVEDFPKLRVGIGRSELAAKAFVNAGMKCVIVGNAWLTGSNIIHRQGWGDLAAAVLPE